MDGIEDRTGALTGLIQAAQAGDRAAANAVFDVLYDELKRLAHKIHRPGQPTLDTTALVHEAWLKLAPAEDVQVESRAHFKHFAARAMRQIVLDEARARRAEKRGGARRAVTLDEALDGRSEADPTTVIELDRALEVLEEADPRPARVVECRVFGGLDVEETAEALSISTATVKRDFRAARAFLADHLERPGA